MALHLCSVGYEREMAFAAIVGERESERIGGSSCYFVDPATGLADVAYMVDPEWQGAGLGSLLEARTIEYARAPRIDPSRSVTSRSSVSAWSFASPTSPGSSVAMDAASRIASATGQNVMPSP